MQLQIWYRNKYRESTGKEEEAWRKEAISRRRGRQGKRIRGPECRRDAGLQEEQKQDSRSIGGMNMVEEGKQVGKQGGNRGHQGKDKQHLLNKSIIDLHMWLHVSQHVFGDNG